MLQSALSLVLCGDGKAPAQAKCLLTDFQDWSCLLAFVFASLNHADNGLDELAVVSAFATNLLGGFVVLDIVFEDAVENFIRWQRILIGLIRTQLG